MRNDIWFLADNVRVLAGFALFEALFTSIAAEIGALVNLAHRTDSGTGRTLRFRAQMLLEDSVNMCCDKRGSR